MNRVELTNAIWDRAVQLQREREARRPDNDGVRRCAERLQELAGDQDILDYLRQRVEEMNLGSPHDGATLWAWRVQHPVTGEYVGNRYLAHAWAEDVTRADPQHPVTVIHLTPGGAEMDQHWLNDRRVLNTLQLDPADVRAVWDRLSQRYAEHIRGHVTVFSDHMHTAAILYRTELPAVRQTPEAGAGRVEFVHPPPTHLPAELRQLLIPGPVRARVQLDDPAKPGYLDTAVVLRLPPGQRDRMLAAVLAAVDAVDAQNSGHAGTSSASVAAELATAPRSSARQAFPRRLAVDTTPPATHPPGAQGHVTWPTPPADRTGGPRRR